MKHFIHFLKSESTEFRRPMILAILAAGVINGIGVAVAVRAVGDVKGGQLNFKAMLFFAACIVGYWVSKEIVLNRTTVVLEQIIERLRLRILAKIREADLLSFEAMDKGRIYATLSSDAIGISTSAGMVINASSSLVMLVFTIALLAALSFSALLMTVALVGIIILYYMRHSRRVAEELANAAARENDFFDNLNGFLGGFKELKLNRDKRSDYFNEELAKVIHATNVHRVDAGKAMNHSLLIAHTYLFFTLAGLIFVLPVLMPSQASLIPSLVPVVLFSAGPLADVVSSIPALAKAEAAIGNIYQLEATVDRTLQQHTRDEPEVDLAAPRATFRSLRCEGLTFQYPANGRHAFTIKPTDFELTAGKIVFIVGGNGSGKSTLLKLLTGLYRPAGGRLLLNEEEIHESNVTKLREMFSPIFTDFHLFKRVLGQTQVDEQRVTELLARMELEGKTSIENGRITNMDLSTGQRKRLALVLSTLDDRPIHLFDEWAADQDPVFRRFFYEVLLRQMATEGKTVLAVTHDDHYFHVADEVYMMEYGAVKPYKAARRRRKTT
jgi:putative ATP-binding cassette transporter